MRSDAIAPDGRTAHRGRETTSERVIDHLLEGLAEAMNLLLDHPGHVGVERQRCPHEVIMMPSIVVVKMTIQVEQNRPRLSNAHPSEIESRSRSPLSCVSGLWGQFSGANGLEHPPGPPHGPIAVGASTRCCRPSRGLPGGAARRRSRDPRCQHAVRPGARGRRMSTEPGGHHGILTKTRGLGDPPRLSDAREPRHPPRPRDSRWPHRARRGLRRSLMPMTREHLLGRPPAPRARAQRARLWA